MHTVNKATNETSEEKKTIHLLYTFESIVLSGYKPKTARVLATILKCVHIDLYFCTLTRPNAFDVRAKSE